MNVISGENPPPSGLIRIGELSRRVGASPHLLRVWERRYGVLQPTRTSGGFRLYSLDDERRVRLMQRLIGQGYSPAAAARLARSDPVPARPARPAPDPARTPMATARAELGDALESFDELGGQRVLDRVLAAHGIDIVLQELVLPYLRDLGQRWHDGDATIAQEHFASSVIRSRLLGLARGWDTGRGPRAVLACPSGERHDIGLICFGLALRARAWRITFLGPDTPLVTIGHVAEELEQDAVVLATMDPARLADHHVELAVLARLATLLLTGPGATRGLASAVGATHLEGGSVDAVQRLAGAHRQSLGLWSSGS